MELVEVRPCVWTDAASGLVSEPKSITITVMAGSMRKPVFLVLAAGLALQNL